jgi:diadenylate cyclase
MGSRHRAGLGISEITDSLTILVSEETGNVSVAIEGILLKMNDRDKLMEYLNMFMK